MLAQLVAIALAQAAPPLPVYTGDATGDPGAAALFEPIRLGLMSDAMAGFSGSGPCEGGSIGTSSWRLTDPSTNPGTPANYGWSKRLAPQLHLVGFGRSGCAMDGAAGGALVFTRPITKTVDLILSAGALYLPQFGPGTKPVAQAEVRADIKVKSGLMLGVVVAPLGLSRLTIGRSF